MTMIPLRLALISNDRETLDGVKDYFERAGARLRATNRLEEASDTAAGAEAVVFFADDYPLEEARAAVAGLSVRLVVIVTADVAAFNACRKGRASAERIVVLPRPAWGWVLLEAIRASQPSLGY